MTAPSAKRLRLSGCEVPRQSPQARESLLRREEFDGPPCAQLVARGVRSTPYGFQRALLGFGCGRRALMCCDDMGLGKTFQVLSLMRMDPPSRQFLEDATRVARYRGNTLVVVLKVTLEQWEQEYHRHLRPLCGAHRPLVFYGSACKRISLAELCSAEMVVTTYDCLRQSGDSPVGSTLLSVQWWRVVLDEAHVIRNPASRKFAVIDQLECCRRVALSGTPVHNKVDDLFPMLRFLRLDGFHASLDAAKAHWKTNYQSWLDAGQKERVHQQISDLLDPAVIRRMKSGTWRGAPIVKGLPRKRFRVVAVKFKQSEDDLYSCIEQKCLQKARDVLKAGDRLKGTDDAAFGKLHALRLCCNVPQMCVDTRGRDLYTGSACAVCNVDAVSLFECGCTVCADCTDSLDACPACGKRLGRGVPVDASTTHNDPAPSSKHQELYRLLCDMPHGDKAIVFSSWIMALDSIQRHAMKGRFERFARVDGKTTGNERRRQLDSFRNDKECRVILMTIGAGGTGIDLREANHVFITDPHWNPAIESQACDRAYRIGQTKDVTITRLIQQRACGADTIERVIQHVQRSKQHVMDTVFPKPPARAIMRMLEATQPAGA
jgi:SNF2 family DNA or RNA helicase